MRNSISKGTAVLGTTGLHFVNSTGSCTHIGLDICPITVDNSQKVVDPRRMITMSLPLASSKILTNRASKNPLASARVCLGERFSRYRKRTYSFRIPGTYLYDGWDEALLEELALIRTYVVADRPFRGGRQLVLSTDDDWVTVNTLCFVLNTIFHLNAELL